MWYNHLRVTISFALVTVAIICLIPLHYLTNNKGRLGWEDIPDMYKEVADDIYSK
jgi:hypothetical protein